MVTELGYDTVRLFLPLPYKQARYIDERLHVVKGEKRFANFTSRLNPYGFELIGSLSRLQFGNNVELVTDRNVKETLDTLSEELECDMTRATVLRLDVSSTIETDCDPHDYFPYLESSGLREINDTFPNTRYLNSVRSKDVTKQRKLPVFYDKGKEADVAGNLLRLELRLQHRVKQQLHLSLPRLIAQDLTDTNVYRASAGTWRKDFLRIVRTPLLNKDRYNPTASQMKSTGTAIDKSTSNQTRVAEKKWSGKDFLQHFFELGVSAYPDEARALLKELKKSGALPASTYYRYMKLIRSIPEPERDNHLQELHTRIEETYHKAVSP
jgi:hypothetical protein